MPYLNINDNISINYKLIRRKSNKNIVLRFKLETSPYFQISAPPYVAKHEIEKFIVSSQDYISKCLAKKFAEQKFCNNTSFKLLDQNIIINHHYGRNKIILDNNILQIHCNDKELINAKTMRWLKKYMYEWFLAESNKYSQVLQVKFNKLQVKSLKSKWGSLDQNKSLVYNWRLAFAPTKVARYVVTHEIVHLIHFNHSKEFWKLLNNINPDAQYAQQWLKQHGSFINNYGK